VSALRGLQNYNMVWNKSVTASWLYKDIFLWAINNPARVAFKDLMSKINSALKILLFVAASTLVVNDCVRLMLAFDGFQIAFMLDRAENEEESKPLGSFSMFEEEVKHKASTPTIFIELVVEEELTVFVTHLIQDDEIRHLAYMPIFSPPPDPA
jgi:hypothetical protein